jgi:anthranilate synthase component 1
MTNATTRTDRLRARIETIDGDLEPGDLFHRLTDGGNRPGSILLESGEIAPTYAERSIGVFRPSLSAAGKDGAFRVDALDRRGECLLEAVSRRLPREAVVTDRSRRRIEGRLDTVLGQVCFDARLSSASHAGILRALLLDFEAPESEPPVPFGLFGCFAYDFVRQFEDVPRPRADVLGDPDYVFYLATRFFLTDHARRRTRLVSVIPGEGFEAEAEEDLARMTEAANDRSPLPAEECRAGEFRSDTSEGEFHEGVRFLKRAVAEGRVFQTVYGRMLDAEFHGSPFAAYRRLERCNPSPYLFYLRDERGALLGASPELAVRVSHDGDRRLVELRPIAGTKPRGLVDGSVDPALDERYETALRSDAKELAEHTMLIDLARNDVASVSETGTTRLVRGFAVEKYSLVQHLVSTVRGTLRDGIDSLGAYLATMNMGTLTGAPKPEAMKLVSEVEKSARGFFGGGVGFLTAGGEMETAIVIRAMRILDDRVYVRAGAGIVADSIPGHEWTETERKARSCIQALGPHTGAEGGDR